MSLRHALLPFLVTLAGACTADAPVQYRVPDIRVLAIRGIVGGTTDRADPDPGFAALPGTGETLGLEALVANPRGRLGLTVGWFACAPPVEGSPCDPTQLRDLDAFETAPGVFPLGTGESISLDFAALPTIPLDPFDPSDPAFLRLGIDAAMAVVADAAFPYPCARYAELPVIAIVRADGLAEATLKRVRLRPTSLLAASPPVPDYYVENHNPGVVEIRTAPTDPEACTGGTLLPASLPAATVTVCAATAPSPRDPYSRCEGTVPVVPQPSESHTVQWYVTAGEIPEADFNGNVEGTHIDLTPAAGSSTLWVIVRDGNGGTDWVTLQLTVP